jgi:hypothetical protein
LRSFIFIATVTSSSLTQQAKPLYSGSPYWTIAPGKSWMWRQSFKTFGRFFSPGSMWPPALPFDTRLRRTSDLRTRQLWFFCHKFSFFFLA